MLQIDRQPVLELRKFFYIRANLFHLIQLFDHSNRSFCSNFEGIAQFLHEKQKKYHRHYQFLERIGRTGDTNINVDG